MKQFVLKHYKERPTTTTNQPSDNKSKAKAEKDSTITKKPRGTKGKNGLVRSMAWYHSTVTLETGTLAANTKRVFTPSPTPVSSKPTTATPAPSTPVLDRPDLQRLVVECLQEAPRLSAGVKRETQRLVGQFVETMNKEMDAAELRFINKLRSTTESITEADLVRKLAEARRDAISDDERRILDHLCERIKPEEDNSENEGDCETKSGEDNGDIDDKDGGEQVRFLQSFLVFLYSGNYPEMKNKTVESHTKDIGVIPTVNTFIDWLVDRKLYNPPRSRGEIDVQMPFTPNNLVRSVSGQLALELKKIYRNGTFDLYKKAEVMKKKGTLGTTIDIQIREEISAAENFLHLNKLTNNSRKIAPFTTSQQPFVSFSERELALFFWKRKPLRERLEELGRQDHTQITSTNDLETWIGGKEPGYIIKHFVCDVAPHGLTSRQRKKAGHRAAIRLLPLNEIGAHLDVVKDKHLDPSQYKEREYLLRGSIRADGFRVQLLAFKLRELQDVRYRRLPENRLPPRLTSTVGGTDYYLQEIRHLITSKDDIVDASCIHGVLPWGPCQNHDFPLSSLSPLTPCADLGTFKAEVPHWTVRFMATLTLSDKEMAWFDGALDNADKRLTTGLSDPFKKNLLSEFEMWKRDKTPTFWLRRSARTAIDTAAVLIEGSVPYAKDAILQNATEQVASSSTTNTTSSPLSPFLDDICFDEDLDDDENGYDPVPDPHVARARTSPFYELVDFIFKKSQGQDPSLPALPPGLSSTHSEMFGMALKLLREPGDVTKKKSVLSKTLDDLRANMQAALYPDPDDPAAMSVESLQRFVYESLLQSIDPRPTRAAKEKYLALKIVSQVLHWLENDNFTSPVSEHVFVSAWSDILNTLFAQSGLRGIPGELGSRTSRESRLLTESVFGGKTVTSTSSRKVDLTIRVFVDKSWADEICEFECKSLVSDLVCQVQQGKSVRLNIAILLALEEKGLDIAQYYPIVAETRGLSIDFYTLRRYGDIIGCGRSTQEKVWLPFGYTKLNAFLSSRSLEVLLGFRAHMALYAKTATATLASSPITPHSTLPVSAALSLPATSRSKSVSEPWSSSASTPLITSSQGSTPDIIEPPPQRPTTPPPRKRDLPFVMFSPCKSQRRGSTPSSNYDRPTMQDNDNPFL
ncbi:hypothetical protein KI688_004861 [Linnemannia hyalina]|uniref:Uncharacterized protein n=1 Tax=Linnemannia hyalina TaxID=64524 RepID=A0A9P7XLT0_9FUNG|nr:hypothetical protein KI688_004861 [Linnemannia hyalina]